MTIRSQLRWCGHLVRMDESRLPKAIFYSQLKYGKRTSCGQYLRYRDATKRHRNAFKFYVKIGKNLPNRDKNGGSLSISQQQVLRRKVFKTSTKNAKSKSRPKPSYTYTYNHDNQLYCVPCNMIFKTKFGFASYIRAHNRH